MAAAYPAAAASTAQPLVAVIAAAALLVLAVALAVRVALLVPLAVALAAVAYGVLVAFQSESSLDVRAPLVATGLVLAGELAWWSIDLGGAPEDRGLSTRRAFEVSVLGVGSATLGTVLLAVSVGGFGGGLAAVGVGVVAAAGTVAVITVLARRFAR